MEGEKQVLAGWLKKKSPNLLGLWQKRWVVLTTTELSYSDEVRRGALLWAPASRPGESAPARSRLRGARAPLPPCRGTRGEGYTDTARPDAVAPRRRTAAPPAARARPHGVRNRRQLPRSATHSATPPPTTTSPAETHCVRLARHSLPSR